MAKSDNILLLSFFRPIYLCFGQTMTMFRVRYIVLKHSSIKLLNIAPENMAVYQNLCKLFSILLI